MDFSLSPGSFPASATVDVYAASDWAPATIPTGAPTGSSVATATAGADGSVAFTGLTAGTAYFAYSLVGSEHRYVRFTPAAAAGGGGGGSAAQVFEVTDLLIPAGTDWSENLHILGSFPLTNADLIIPNIYIEVAAPLTGSDLLGIGLVDAQVASGGNWWGPGAAVESDVPGVWAYNADTQRLSGIVPGTPDLTSVPTPVTAYVYLSTGGPTTADITIVRARAAFLVI